MHATRRRAASGSPFPSSATSASPGSGGGRGSASTRYEVLEREGEGTLWVTYRVRERHTGLVCALKALKATFAKHPRLGASIAQALEQEAGLRGAGLAHPHLASVYEAGLEEGTPYFVTDWLAGGSLEQKLKRAPLNRSEAISVTRSLAEALEALHARGLCHGDVRPRQVRLQGDGSAKLTDASHARAFHAAGVQLTDIIGDAAYYQAPERWDNREPSVGADLYALGVILYRMLSARVPFEGTSPLAIAMRHRRDAPIKPSQFNDSCPRDLERIALRLLEKDPVARYVSAAHLLRDLSAAPADATPGTAASPATVAAVAPPAQPPVAGQASPAVIAPARPMPTPPSAAVGAATAGAIAASAATASAAAGATTAAVATGSAAGMVAAGATGTAGAGRVVPPIFRGQQDVTDDIQDDADVEHAEQQARRKHKWREFWGMVGAFGWMCIVAAALGGMVYGAHYMWIQSIPNEVKVPEYRGKSQYEVERVLASKGLKFRVAREVYDPKRASGTVLSGEPVPGKTVRSGREVAATVSRGPEPIRMYDFSELTLQQARQVVMRDGLRMGQVAEQFHDRIPAGYICGQYPEPGEPFRRSDPINLIVSRGPQPSSEIGEIPALPPMRQPTLSPEDAEGAQTPPMSGAASESGTTLVSRVVQVRVAIPADGQAQEVRVVARDIDGERVAYRQTHQPGEVVSETVQVTRQQGATAVVRIYVGGTLFREQRI
jgi:hypothetical protein